MENYFYFEKKLNWKKVLIFSLIILLIIGTIIFLIVKSNKPNDISIQNKSSNISTFTDDSNTFNITLPDKFMLTQVHSNSNYILELRASNNLYILFSKKDLTSSWFTENEIIEKDKEKYTSKFENVSNLSDTASYMLNDLQISSYTFEYTYLGNAFCSEIIWIKKDDSFYVVDISYLKEYSEQYIELSQYLLNNLKFTN